MQYVSGARLLTLGVFECDIAQHRSAAVLCMLFQIRHNPLHPLYGTQSVHYVPERVTRGALVAHRYTYESPRCRTSLYGRTFSLISVSLYNELAAMYSMVWHWRISRACIILLYRPKLLSPFLSSNVFPFSSFFL